MMPRVAPAIGFLSTQQEIVLTGTVEDLAAVAYSLVFTGMSRKIGLYVPEETPEPYVRFMQSIEITDEASPIKIGCYQTTLFIRGSVNNRQLLAHEILQAIEPDRPILEFVEKHILLCHSTTYPFVAITSLPLILSIVGTGGSDIWSF